MIVILEKLLDRFQHISDYAETKLAMIIAFNSAVIFGLLAIFSDQCKPIKIVIFIIVLLNISSVISAFLGLFAKISNHHVSSKKEALRNYYYFKYVAHLSEKELLDGIRENYDHKSENELMEQDLANQIIILAKIASKKFHYFNVAMYFTIAAITTPIGLGLFCLIKKRI
jgi:hypothetical protein